MPVVDYDFYANGYLGSLIPEKAFAELSTRAEEHLNALRRKYRVSTPDRASEKMAICAMAEVLYGYRGKRAGVTAATVGGVSVRYDGAYENRMHRELLRQAGIYLDIYRGVGK